MIWHFHKSRICLFLQTFWCAYVHACTCAVLAGQVGCFPIQSSCVFSTRDVTWFCYPSSQLTQTLLCLSLPLNTHLKFGSRLWNVLTTFLSIRFQNTEFNIWNLQVLLLFHPVFSLFHFFKRVVWNKIQNKWCRLLCTKVWGATGLCTCNDVFADNLKPFKWYEKMCCQINPGTCIVPKKFSFFLFCATTLSFFLLSKTFYINIGSRLFIFCAVKGKICGVGIEKMD